MTQMQSLLAVDAVMSLEVDTLSMTSSQEVLHTYRLANSDSGTGSGQSMSPTL